MAIEDGAALGVLFSHLPSKAEIPTRLQIFQSLRINRVSAMVVFSSVGQDEYAKIADQAREFVEGRLPREFLLFFEPHEAGAWWEGGRW